MKNELVIREVSYISTKMGKRDESSLFRQKKSDNEEVRMSEKRFKVVQDPRVQTEYFIYDNENKISRNITDYPFINQDVCSKIVMLLNEQQEEIAYWKHRVSSLLWILSQFDNEKVKKLLEELDEREEI